MHFGIQVVGTENILESPRAGGREPQFRRGLLRMLLLDQEPARAASLVSVIGLAITADEADCAEPGLPVEVEPGSVVIPIHMGVVRLRSEAVRHVLSRQIRYRGVGIGNEAGCA